MKGHLTAMNYICRGRSDFHFKVFWIYDTMETIIQKIVFIIWVVPFFVIITRNYNYPAPKHNISNSAPNLKSLEVKNQNQHEEYKMKDNFWSQFSSIIQYQVKFDYWCDQWNEPANHMFNFSKEQMTRLNRFKTNTAHERNNSKCEDSHVLPLINDVSNSATLEKSIIMLETSKNPWLIARCINEWANHFKGLIHLLLF